MGSACSTENGTVVAASDLSVKAQLEEHVKVSSRTTLEEAKDNEKVKMEKQSKPRQNEPVEQQTNEITDSKHNEKTERKDDESDDKIDKEKEVEDDKDSEDDDAEEGQKKKQEPFTEEELRTFKEEKYKNLRNTADDVFALESFQSEGGEYVKAIRNATVRFYNSYFALKRTNMAEIVKYRLECAKILTETRSIDLCCDIIIYTYTNGWYNEEGKKNELKFSPLNKCLVLLMNFTDCSDELTTYLSGKKEFLDFLRNVFVDYRDRHFGKSEPQLKPTEERILYSVLSIVHNLSMRESIIETLREHGFVHTLQPFLDSSKPMYRLNALASLAGIINEEECEIINANKNSVVFLLKVLGNCLADKRRRHRGWSAKESGLAVRTLARNDANKKLLAELGALELLVQLGKTGNTGEQYESVAAVWALCFDADNRVLVTAKEELGVVDLLLELKQVDDPEIKKVCNGALWTLREDLKNSSVEKYKKIGEQLIGQNEKHKAEILVAQNEARETKGSCGHVMISYQWGNQEMLKTVRDRIKAYGYKVWMDIDQMGGSTLQAMADAVEGADVFLMCMSNRYKNSPACRAEAEYAFQTRKKIIPLKMEAGYNADGWLGFILGAKLFFDFSGKYPFEDKMAGLLKELDGAMKKVHGKEVKATQQQVSVVTAAPGPHGTRGPTTSSAAISTSKIPVVVETLSNVRNWSKEEVKKWVDANDLKVCGFEDMTGSEIAYLAKMQANAPEFFHKFLHDTLNAKTVSTIARIGWALHDLTAGQQSSS